VAGDRLEVAPYARRVAIVPRAGADTVTLREPRRAYGDRELSGWSLAGGPVQRFGTEVSIEGGRALDVRLHGFHDVLAREVAAPAWRPWPKLRRAGTEARDRALALRPARARWRPPEAVGRPAEDFRR
jgi:hypothetical protein